MGPQETFIKEVETLRNLSNTQTAGNTHVVIILNTSRVTFLNKHLKISISDHKHTMKYLTFNLSYVYLIFKI